MRPPGNGAGRAADTEEEHSLNNNNRNNSNNRRRGRGNRNQSGGGGQQNRIDSRARGNAPQMLDKYKKLAQDAQHNGDRVQMEYYLQFADHYFRVIADNKSRQDEPRSRRDERDFDDEDSAGNGSDNNGEPRSDSAGDDRRRDNPRSSRGRRDESGPMDRGTEGEEVGAEENPFAHGSQPERDERPAREARAAREDRPERRPRRRASAGERIDVAPQGDAPAAFDAAVLPPSISAAASDSDAGEAAKPKLKPRRRRTTGDAAEAVETVES